MVLKETYPDTYSEEIVEKFSCAEREIMYQNVNVKVETFSYTLHFHLTWHESERQKCIDFNCWLL